MSTGILNNNQIWNLADKHHLPLRAVLMSGEITSNMIPKDGMYVFNMDRHPNGHGTHWVAAYCQYPECVYFDSFGYPPNIPISQFLKKRYPAPLANHKEIQDYYHDSCGDWCLAFGIGVKKNLEEMGLVGAADYFLSQFDKHTIYNELMLNNMHI